VLSYDTGTDEGEREGRKEEGGFKTILCELEGHGHLRPKGGEGGGEKKEEEEWAKMPFLEIDHAVAAGKRRRKGGGEKRVRGR